MPSQTTSPPPLTVTVLAALWRLPSIDTVYHPEAAKLICMDKPISCSHTIPNSGAYRPVRAEIGEYLYCPPQRWLNNLHHGATVLLYHPCAPLHERLLLSALARSCLPEYIMTTHPQLSKHMPIALVSWGRTLELSTVASLDICDWLQTTTTTRNKFSVVSQKRKYNLLLTWSAEQHRQQHTHPDEHSTKIKESLKQCCEHTISSLLNGAMEVELDSTMKDKKINQLKKEVNRRQRRAAIRENQENDINENMKENTTTQVSNQSNKTIINRTGNAQNDNSTHRPSADSPPGNTALSDPPGQGETPTQSKLKNQNQSLTPSLTLKSDSLRVRAFESQPSADGEHSEQNHTDRPKDEGTDSTKLTDKDSAKRSMKEKIFDEDFGSHGRMKDNEVVDVIEREVAHKHTHSGTHSHHINEKTGFDSVPKAQSKPLAHQHPNPQPDSHLTNTLHCDGCKAGEHCECTNGSGAEDQAVDMSKGLLRTPRTDEALWAAAALGFLLVLLTLSVLHTRLYRHWRTTPSLYWHDPQQDYDSVADVIRRRLRIANRRRKRSRRQECVLLPSSSSSDEFP
ncbi:hypothetical protein PAMP_018891 [Pampus punctatissimus]